MTEPVRRAVAVLLDSTLAGSHCPIESWLLQHTSALIHSDTFKRIASDQPTQILVDEGISKLSCPLAASETGLVRSLEETPLPAWKISVDALPQLGCAFRDGCGAFGLGRWYERSA